MITDEVSAECNERKAHTTEPNHFGNLDVHYKHNELHTGTASAKTCIQITGADPGLIFRSGGVTFDNKAPNL